MKAREFIHVARRHGSYYFVRLVGGRPTCHWCDQPPDRIVLYAIYPTGDAVCADHAHWLRSVLARRVIGTHDLEEAIA